MIKATHRCLTLLLISVAVLVAGCSSTSTRKGGYYQDDGPGNDIPADIARIPDAIPRIEPIASGTSRPYSVLGKRYVPMTDPDRPYKQHGIASWYGKKFHGNSTAIGERYDMYAMTAAHPTMPLPSYARVTSNVNGRTVIVRVNDRGPFHRGRIMDLSYVAAYKLGLIGNGSGEVTVERILPSEIRLAASQGKTVTASGMTTSAASAMAATDTTVPARTPVEATPVVTDLVAPTPLSTQPGIATKSRQATAAAGTVYLQVGAFSQPGNAQALAQRVNQQLNTEVGDAPASIQQNGSLYRVWLGPYADRETALIVAQQVADRTGIRPSLATQ